MYFTTIALVSAASALSGISCLSQALYYKKYSTGSDVWSYGMLMFEIWSLGEKPFPHLSPTEVNMYDLLVHGAYESTPYCR